MRTVFPPPKACLTSGFSQSLSKRVCACEWICARVCSHVHKGTCTLGGQGSTWNVSTLILENAPLTPNLEHADGGFLSSQPQGNIHYIFITHDPAPVLGVTEQDT